MDKLAIAYSAAIEDETAPLRKAMLLADGIERLRKAITPAIMQRVMSLMNTPLGFVTDRDPARGKKNKQTGQYEAVQPYPEAVVKDCLIAALLNGVFPVNNEFNIVAGKCYVAQAGYWRKCREFPGVTDLVVTPGLPGVFNGKTFVRVRVSWNQDGHKRELQSPDDKAGRLFEVPADAFSGPDQIIGKATRKALKAAYEQMSGCPTALPDGDVDQEEEPATSPAPEQPKPGPAQLPPAATNGKAPEAAAEPEPRQPGEDDPEPQHQTELESGLQDLYDDCRQRIKEAKSLREADQCLVWCSPATGLERAAAGQERGPEEGHRRAQGRYQEREGAVKCSECGDEFMVDAGEPFVDERDVCYSCERAAAPPELLGTEQDKTD